MSFFISGILLFLNAMRRNLNKVSFVVFFLFGIMDLFAGPGGSGPPVPTSKKAPPPPGLSIDENIILIAFLAVLFGIYLLYSIPKKNKTPN